MIRSTKRGREDEVERRRRGGEERGEATTPWVGFLGCYAVGWDGGWARSIGCRAGSRHVGSGPIRSPGSVGQGYSGPSGCRARWVGAVSGARGRPRPAGRVRRRWDVAGRWDVADAVAWRAAGHQVGGSAASRPHGRPGGGLGTARQVGQVGG